MSPSSDKASTAETRSLKRSLVRLICSACALAALIILIGPTQVIGVVGSSRPPSFQRQVIDALHTHDWKITARVAQPKLHHRCGSDTDCEAPSLACKRLTFVYESGQSPFITNRCEPIYCPSTFAEFMHTQNPSMTPAQVADVLYNGGKAHEIEFYYPSPSVNPWDPRSVACKAEETRTKKPCELVQDAPEQTGVSARNR